MPVYNAERFLRASIESIQSQTFKNFELIISDNASTDSTLEICQEYAKNDARITVVSNATNLGAAKNYNSVFQLSQATYFKWAAADDLCAPDYVERCVAILENDPTVILAYPKTKIIDAYDNEIKEYDDGLHLKSKSASGRFLQFVYSVGECNAVFGLIRSDSLKKTRLIGNYIGSDTCLLAELSLSGRFYEIPEYLFFRRHHAAASSYNKDVESQLEFFDPSLNGKIVMQNWRHFVENFKSVRRADIPGSQKFLPTVFLLGGVVVGSKRYFKELVAACKSKAEKFYTKHQKSHIEQRTS